MVSDLNVVPLHFSSLRKAARGRYGLEAGTEMLIRGFNGRFAAVGHPWVINDPDGAWIDFTRIEDEIGVFSSGEQGFLLMAASIGGGGKVEIADAVSSLDRELLVLVLAAIAHAAGSHQSSTVIENRDGSHSIRRTHTVFDWPAKGSRD